MTHITKAIVHVIHQIERLLEALEPAEYSRPLTEFDGSSLGQHFRHILEFCQCLEKGAQQGIVDYAGRDRNMRFEQDPLATMAAFESFTCMLGTLSSDQPLDVKAEFFGTERPLYKSSLCRELMFVYDHAIHHLAMIKIGCRCHFPHINTDPNLGISPSTLKSRAMTPIE
jgi:hypothetical protein